MSSSLCPALGELAVYIDGRARGPARERLERHVASCETCARLVTDARRFFGGAFSTTTRHRLPAVRRQWAVGPVGILALVAGLILLLASLL